jgi:hypothetical protein
MLDGRSLVDNVCGAVWHTILQNVFQPEASYSNNIQNTEQWIFMNEIVKVSRVTQLNQLIKNIT